MKKYFNFLNEKSSWTENITLTKEEFDEMLRTQCSDVDLENDTPIYRSLDLNVEYSIVKKISERKSAYSANYYTLLMNNLPSWSEYPKRTHICSNVKNNFNTSLYRIIPFNGAKVGVCPMDDIQAPLINTLAADFIYTNYKKQNINGFINLYRQNFEPLLDEMIDSIPNHYHLSSDIRKVFRTLQKYYVKGCVVNGCVVDDSSFETFKQSLENVNYALQDINVDYETDKNQKIFQSISMLDLNEMNEILDPNKLGFKSVEYNEYKTMVMKKVKFTNQLQGVDDYMHEVWLDGDILLQKI